MISLIKSVGLINADLGISIDNLRLVLKIGYTEDLKSGVRFAAYTTHNIVYEIIVEGAQTRLMALFKDKNLIVVMMESVNDVIYNEEYFPNFYKLATEGWYFENNYSPRNSCATGNNEFSAMTGLYSIYNSCTSNVYVKNTYYEAIFNLFNDNKLITSRV